MDEVPYISLSEAPEVRTLKRESGPGIPSYGIRTLPEKITGTTEESFIKWRETKDPNLREELILRHIDLVRKLASRFANRGQPTDTLLS